MVDSEISVAPELADQATNFNVEEDLECENDA